MLAIFCLIVGFVIGYLWRDSRKENTKKKSTPIKNRQIYLNYNERQRAKLIHQNEAERIRQLNLLSTNECKFMRLLQHEFTEFKLIIKDRRFYIADQDYYPLCIFEYRDGTKKLRVEDKEDGIPIFLYKGILSSEAITQDKQLLNL